MLARRRAEVAALQGSPLFDAAWYLRQHPGLAAAGHDPAAHYAWTGAPAGAQPNPWFDTAFYLGRNPAVAASGENPLLHWIRTGAAEGLDPNAFLDVDWYVARHGVAATGLDPLTHYIRHGIPGGLDPNPGLDAAAYAMEGDRGGPRLARRPAAALVAHRCRHRARSGAAVRLRLVPAAPRAWAPPIRWRTGWTRTAAARPIRCTCSRAASRSRSASPRWSSPMSASSSPSMATPPIRCAASTPSWHAAAIPFATR